MGLVDGHPAYQKVHRDESNYRRGVRRDSRTSGFTPQQRPSRSARLDRCQEKADNVGMNIPGRVRSGVVVLDGGASLPEGTPVTVSCADEAVAGASRPARRVELPLISSKHPGTLPLTAERVAELLDDAHVSA